MGYEMSLRDEKFYIKKENKDKALELLKELCCTDNDIRWVSNSSVISASTLEEAIKECLWSLRNDDDGNVVGINFEMEYAGDELKIFNAIAPAVEIDSYIEMCGACDDIWRWVFKDGKCEEVRPKIEWQEKTP